MNLWVAIFGIIRLWTPPVIPEGERPPETVGEYEIRLERISRGAASAAEEKTRPWWPKVVRAAGVIMIFREESRFDWWIHAGLPHPDPRRHQDHGVAHCMGSIHPSRLIPEYPYLAGTSEEATTRCAKATLRMLRSSVWACARDDLSEHGMARALEQYATGAADENGAPLCPEPSKQSKERAAMWMKIARQLDKDTCAHTRALSLPSMD